MTTEELIEQATAAGVRLRQNGEKLRVDAPKGVLVPELLDALKEHKPAILAFLAQRRAERILAAIVAAGEADLTHLYQTLCDVPIADLRAELSDLVTNRRIGREDRPVPGLAGYTVSVYSQKQ